MMHFVRTFSIMCVKAQRKGLSLSKRFESMEKIYTLKTFLKMAGGRCIRLILLPGFVSSHKLQKIKSSLYSPHYAEACNELRGPSPRLSAWATQLRRNVATVASCWRHCADLTGPGIEPQTSRTESVRFATELTAGCHKLQKPLK